MKITGISLRYALFVLGAAIAAMLVMELNSRMEMWHKLQAHKDAVIQEQVNLLETKKALEAQLAYVTSEAAVARWAYRDGKMVRPGDWPIVPLQIGEPAPPPTPTPTKPPQQPSNLESWLQLFTAPRPP